MSLEHDIQSRFRSEHHKIMVNLIYTYNWAMEKSKRFFNGTRLSVTGRISKGVFGIYGSYQVNQFIKDGLGPDIRPFQIGISISGL